MFAAIALILACSTPVVGVQHHDAPASAAWMKSQADAVVVDVRTPGEFAAGHVEGAVNIDYRGADFAEKVAALPKGKPILVHCQSGGRSRSALPAFTAAGHAEVHHMDGGFGAWVRAGLPVAK